MNGNAGHERQWCVVIYSLRIWVVTKIEHLIVHNTNIQFRMPVYNFMSLNVRTAKRRPSFTSNLTTQTLLFTFKIQHICQFNYRPWNKNRRRPESHLLTTCQKESSQKLWTKPFNVIQTSTQITCGWLDQQQVGAAFKEIYDRLWWTFYVFINFSKYLIEHTIFVQFGWHFCSLSF